MNPIKISATSGSTLVPTGKKTWIGIKVVLSPSELVKWLKTIRKRFL